MAPSKKGGIIALVVPSFSKVDPVYARFMAKCSHVLILSSRISCHQMRKRLSPANNKKADFIDSVSKGECGECTFVSQFALSEMAQEAGLMLKDAKIDLVIVDSLSSLLVYNSDVAVLRFAHDLAQKGRQAGCTILFPILESDVAKKLSKLDMFIDTVEKI